MEVFEFNFEVYTKNPFTGEMGWDIKFVSVFANSKDDAKEYLKKWNLFDCIILHNFTTPSESTFKVGSIVDSVGYSHYKLTDLLFVAV